MKQCKLCERPHRARGYCDRHYKALRKTGELQNKQIHNYHGYSGRPEYYSWHNAIRRCTEPTNKRWAEYGGRGITVCSGVQQDFNNFLAAVGNKPTSKHTIDRLDNEKGYWCGLCAECTELSRINNLRWADVYQQANNKRGYKNNTSGHAGVTLTYNSKWCARIYNKGKRIVVGTFDTIEEAVAARKAALDKLY